MIFNIFNFFHGKLKQKKQSDRSAFNTLIVSRNNRSDIYSTSSNYMMYASPVSILEAMNSKPVVL